MYTSCNHFGGAIKIQCCRATVKHVVRLTCKIREYSCRYRVCMGPSHTRRCRPRNLVPWSQVHTCTCNCPRTSDTRPRFDRATRRSNPVARNGHLKKKKIMTMLFNVCIDAHSRYARSKNSTVCDVILRTRITIQFKITSFSCCVRLFF